MPELITMNEICRHVRRSESTVLMLYRTAGFPMVKIGGCWESTTEEIDEWRKQMIQQDIGSRNGGKNTRKKTFVKQKNW